jgi:D-ribose pyranose/furanose isomerase RbsD
MANVELALSKAAPEAVNVLAMVLNEAREDATREATEREEAEESAEQLLAVLQDLETLEDDGLI